MDSSVLVVIVLTVSLMGFIIWRKIVRNEQAFSQLYRPVEGDLPEDEDELGEVIAFAGEHEFETVRFRLEAGEYKLRYWFPEHVMVKVVLFSAAGDDHEIIALKKGEGETAFTVEAAGRYFCSIEPAEDGEWEIEISKLGLPSGYRPSY